MSPRSATEVAPESSDPIVDKPWELCTSDPEVHLELRDTVQHTVAGLRKIGLKFFFSHIYLI